MGLSIIKKAAIDVPLCEWIATDKVANQADRLGDEEEPPAASLN